ncbi:MAG: hypothetical protein R3321_01315 [Nitrososphaeraceae archaeon]|nr:hypothetical protein [Nitrososphaeraceae archaeon]
MYKSKLFLFRQALQELRDHTGDQNISYENLYHDAFSHFKSLYDWRLKEGDSLALRYDGKVVSLAYSIVDHLYLNSELVEEA